LDRVISRHKNLIFDLGSSSVIANDKIYYATSAIYFLVFILVAAGSRAMQLRNADDEAVNASFCPG
jgi:hypothetical protein